MATFLILGTYTNKGAKGLVEKNSDRQEANDVNYIPPTEWINISNELFLRKF